MALEETLLGKQKYDGRKKVIMISFASARQVESETTRQINSQFVMKRAS